MDEVEELIRKDLNLAVECTRARLRKLLDECGTSQYRRQTFLTFVF